MRAYLGLFCGLLGIAAAHATPSLSSISPNPVTGSSSAQTFTLTGSAFVSGAKVQVAFASNGYTFVNTSTNASYVSSTQLTVPITTSTTADTWKVRVQNPDTTLSNQINLVVNAPTAAPTLNSISPNPVTGSNSAQTFTVSGLNFVSGAKVQVAYASNGYSFVNTSTNASFSSSSQLTVPITTTTTADTWKVRVQNPDGQLSGQINLVVNAPVSAPTLSSISPNPVTGSNSAQTFTLSGSNFVSGAKVQVAYASNGYSFVNTSTNASFSSSSQLTVPITTTTTADTWKVRVQNPDGQLSGQINLVVNAPVSAPTLSSISPNPVTGSNSAQTFTLSGSNFVSGAKVQVAYASNGYSFVNTSTNASFSSSSQLTVPITTTTTADTWKVRVQNPDGQLSGQIDLVVTAPASAPTLNSISPNPVTGSNSAQTFTLSGSNFVNGAKVQVAYASNGYSFVNTSTNASFSSSSQLTVPITTSTTADTWKVRVQNPDGQLSGQIDLVVNAPVSAPTLSSISPNPVTGSNSAQTFTLSGSNFVSGAKVQVAYASNGYSFVNTSTNASFVNSTQLTVPITTSTTGDTWKVRVQNPDGQLSGQIDLVVNAPTSAPTLSTISPNPVTGSSSPITFTLTGSNFVSGAKVQVAYSGNGYTFVDTNTNATFNSSTTLTVPITTQPQADTWHVRVKNPDGQLSGQIDLVVNATASAPTLSTITPNPVTGSNSPITFTLTGGNFVSGAKVQVAYSGNGYTFVDTNTNATFNSSTTLTVPITTQPQADTWHVRVKNSDGQLSGQIDLVVNVSPSPPTLGTISPNPVTGSSSPITFTLTGSNFVSGAKVQVAYAGNGYTFVNTNTNATFVSATTLTVPITTQDQADTWKVRVQNPDGQLSGEITLTVLHQDFAPPTISGISPNPVTGSNNPITFTVTGSNFVSGAKVQVAYSGNGYTFVDTNTNATFNSSTTLTVPITTQPQADTWHVRVKNPDGQLSGQVDLIVNAPVNTAAPILNSISPNPVTGSSSPITFTVNGANFINGAKVQVAFSSNGYTFVNTSTNAFFTNSTQLTVPITTTTTADTWKVRVMNPDGQISGQINLVVNAPVTTAAPTLSNISPNSVTGSTSSRSFSLFGANFVNGAVVQVAFRDNNYTFQNTSNAAGFVNSSQLSISLTTGTMVDTWQVRVRNPDTQTTNSVNLNVTAVQTSAPSSLIISGPTTVSPSSSNEYRAEAYFSDGSHQDVSGSAKWTATGGPADPGTFGQAIMVGNTLVTNVAAAVTPVQIRATFSGLSSAAYLVTVAGSGVGMTNPSVRYLRPSGTNHVWSITASLYGSAIGSGSTYKWFVDGQQVSASGPDVNIEFSSQPASRQLKVVVVDAQNRTSTDVRSIALDLPAANEPSQKFYPSRPTQGSFVDSSGKNDYVGEQSKVGNGLIIITHGLYNNGDEPWLSQMATGISNRLSIDGKLQPNIAIFRWPEGARPNVKYGEGADDDSFIARYLHVERSVLGATTFGAGGFFFDLLVVYPEGLHYGSVLADWIQAEINNQPSRHIDPGAPIHLIGHSAGGFVMSECARILRQRGILTVTQVTLLDTPLPELGNISPYLSSGGSTLNPGRADFYVSSYFGAVDPELSLQFGLAPNFHRRDLFSIFPLAGTLVPTIAAHGYSHDWYADTSRSGGEHDGFWFSPFMGNRWLTNSVGALLEHANSPSTSTETSQDLTGFDTFGNVSGGDAGYILTENTDAGVVKNFTLPIGAQRLKFRYQFVAAGDGDYLAVYFGDNPPLYIGADLASTRTTPFSAEVPMNGYAGQAGNLVIKLVSRGVPNATVQIDQISLTISDDPDNDGLTTDQEIALGTNPLVSDTDGDGLSDGDEVNIYHTSPLVADSDGDGIRDGDEITGGSDPLNAYSRPGSVNLANISTRLSVGTGDNAMIGGFIITGTQPKKVIVRGIGPSLGAFGVQGTLRDPTLELHDSSGDILAFNDNWKDIQQVDIQATTLAPSNDMESAILRTLNPGNYTAVLRGSNSTSGIGVVEAYDLDQTVDSKLANISTRGFVDTGDNVMIGGTIITGPATANVLFRAIGPSLANFGVSNALHDPTLELHDGNGALIGSNDNWRDSQEIEILGTTIPPTDNRESAILKSLAPGAYTAIVRGVGNSTGVAVVEAYQLQ